MALHACPPRAPLFQTSSQVLRHSTACYRWHRGTASQQVNKARLVCRDGPSKAATDADSQQPAHRVTDSDRSTQQETGRNAAAMGAYLAASGLVSFLAFQQLSSTDLPPLPAWAPWVPAGALGSAASAAAVLKLILGDKFHVHWHRGRLYVQLGVPSQGPAMAPGSVKVRPTGDVRGNGAYATRTIPAGSFIIQYEGEWLEWPQFESRYGPSGESDFVMGIDSGGCIDASALVADTSRFAAVHMNHSSARANVVRYYDYPARGVRFFAKRDIQAGEELVFDYGRAYWRGREQLELP